MIKQSTSKLKTTSKTTTSPFQVSSATTTNLLSNVKIDIKTCPVFDGQVKDWKKYKRQFTSVVSIHVISNCMELSYDMLSQTDTIYLKITTENSFLCPVIEYSLAKSTAVSRVNRHSKTKDGRGSWLVLVDWYEGQGSIEVLAKKALKIIMSHKLTAKSYGGA